MRAEYPDQKLFLNIEPLDENAPNYDQRCRRKAFYERNGLSCLDYQVREAGVTYEMMTYGEYVTRDEYEEVMRVMYGSLLYKIIKAHVKCKCTGKEICDMAKMVKIMKKER